MPLYEYQCQACGHRFEVIQKFSDAPLTACPKCGGTVEKLLSSPAIQFKGSGWYITDYARAGKDGQSSSSTKAGGSSDKKDGSASGASGESSAAPAAESKSAESKPAESGPAKST